MKLLNFLFAVLLAGALGVAWLGWTRARQAQAELEALKAAQQAAQAQSQTAAEAREQQAETELQRLRAQAQDVVKLRGEVSQLRTGMKEVEKLRAENQKLRASLQANAVAAPNAPAPAVRTSQFPRESWTFSGYATPEAALVSAIWAMREGKPQTYLESVSVEERERLLKGWQNVSEADIVAKHQQNVAAITGLRVLEEQSVSENELLMNVYLEGPGRMEKVSMKRVGGDWKFGGYIREQPK